MAVAPPSLWHYLLTPAAAMDAAAAARMNPAMARLAMLTSPATADCLLAPVLPPGIVATAPDDLLRDNSFISIA